LIFSKGRRALPTQQNYTEHTPAARRSFKEPQLTECMKYQKRDLAMAAFGANSFMRYAGGEGSVSVGALRPTT
jgi:hypothetical protein